MVRLLYLSLISIAVVSCAPSHTTKPQADQSAAALDNDMGGCSWYCSAPPITVTASSTFKDGIYSYAPEHLHDGENWTVWVEDELYYGIGETVTFTFDMRDKEKGTSNHEFGVNQVTIVNGFARSEKLWLANSRVKDLKVLYNGKYLTTIHLEDTMKPQRFDLPKMLLRPGRQEKITFEIADVYAGEHHDTALADFSFGGFGDH
jgi:hypothetical protein